MYPPLSPRRDVSLPHNEDLRKSYFYARAFTLRSLFPGACINVATIRIADRIALGISHLVVRAVSGLSAYIIADFSTVIPRSLKIDVCTCEGGETPGQYNVKSTWKKRGCDSAASLEASGASVRKSAAASSDPRLLCRQIHVLQTFATEL